MAIKRPRIRAMERERGEERKSREREREPVVPPKLLIGSAPVNSRRKRAFTQR